MSKYVTILVLVLLVSSCRTVNSANNTAAYSHQITDTPTKNSGSSGMTRVNDSTFIVVYDLKGHKTGTRIGLIEITSSGLDITPIDVSYWGPEGISNDLESVCAIPGKKNEFLAAESGNWQGRFGRIFHIKLDIPQNKATVLGSFKPPVIKTNDRGMVGDQYEGMHCIRRSSTEYVLILAERGGSRAHPYGILRWGTWDVTKNSFTFSNEGKNGIAVNAPGNWTNPKAKRSLTDLYVDAENNIWATASYDQGDLGPFYSVIYKLGNINTSNASVPIAVIASPKVGRHIHGFKIESLAGPAKDIISTHSFGTEDENYGGVWRPIVID